MEGWVGREEGVGVSFKTLIRVQPVAGVLFERSYKRRLVTQWLSQWNTRTGNLFVFSFSFRFLFFGRGEGKG